MNNYKLFWKPPIAFEKVLSDLKKAKKSIYIETFMFGNDKIGRDIVNILVKKAEKIPVTLIVDGYGLQKMNNGFGKQIKESKIQFIIFNNIWQQIRNFNIRKWFRTLPFRNHRKLTIIDKEIAYLGGMNYHHSELKWHDLFVRIKGDIITQLVSSANEMTRIAKKKITAKRKITKQNTQILIDEDCITRQIPLSKQRPLKKQLKKLLRSGKKEINITTPYFIPDPQFHKLLHSAVKRGLKVKLIIPKQSDRSIADILTNINLFIAHKAGIKIKFMNKMTHAKYIIADDYICSFGSANMDYQAFYNNFELNITSKNTKLVNGLKKQFQKDWKNAIPYDFKKWLNRSRGIKFLEKVLHPFRRYF